MCLLGVLHTGVSYLAILVEREGEVKVLGKGQRVCVVFSIVL